MTTQKKRQINPRKTIQRFFVPQIYTCVHYFLKFRSVISPKAEVELSPNIHLGKGVVISSFTKVKATDGPLRIGRESGFATGCFVSAAGKGITIGDYCVFGPNVSIASSNYGYERLDVPYKHQGSTSKGVVIGSNVWVGSSVTILDGSKIGDNCIVVANSLVNRHFPPNCIIQGNPAKIILRREAGSETSTPTAGNEKD